MTTKIFHIDGLPDFLRNGAPLPHLWRLRAPLKSVYITNTANHWKEDTKDFNACATTKLAYARGTGTPLDTVGAQASLLADSIRLSLNLLFGLIRSIVR